MGSTGGSGGCGGGCGGCGGVFGDSEGGGGEGRGEGGGGEGGQNRGRPPEHEPDWAHHDHGSVATSCPSATGPERGLPQRR